MNDPRVKKLSGLIEDLDVPTLGRGLQPEDADVIARAVLAHLDSQIEKYEWSTVSDDGVANWGEDEDVAREWAESRADRRLYVRYISRWQQA